MSNLTPSVKRDSEAKWENSWFSFIYPTSDNKCVGFITLINFSVPAECPKIQFKSNTIYLELPSDLTS